MADNKKIKHHGLAHLVLIVILFLVAVVVFGGWAEGPLTSGLFLGMKAYRLLASTSTGNVEGAGLAEMNVLETAIVFVINLAIYYIIAAIIIFLYNVLFGKGDKN